MARMKRDKTAVFVNVPFDSKYEKQFIALIAAIIALGRKPHSVLEISEDGKGRLTRLFKIIRTCEVSFHDLSRVGVPARFNMPFELGLACAIAQLEPPHRYYLAERQNYRIQRTLSDLNGRDPYVHGGTVRGSIRCVLNALRSSNGRAGVDEVFRLYRTLAVVASALKRSYRENTIFTRAIFIDLVAAGISRAQQVGLITP